MPIPLSGLAGLGANLQNTLGRGQGLSAGGGTASAAGGLANNLQPSTGIPVPQQGAFGIRNAATAAAQQAMTKPSFLSRLGGGLRDVGQFAVGTQQGAMGLGQENLRGLFEGQFPAWGDLSPSQRGALVSTLMPKISVQTGGKTFSTGGGGGRGGLSQALLMSKFLNRKGGDNDQIVIPRAQTKTARALLEPFDVGAGGVQAPRFG